MREHPWRQAAIVILALVLALPAIRAQGSAGSQGPVTSSDLTRLDRTADDIATRADALKSTDPTLADEVTKRLADLRDDITYLKVKLRKEGSVGRQDYADVHDRLETLRNRATSDRVTAQPVINGDPMGRVVTIGVGTEFDVRLQTPLNSGTSKVEQRFEATTILDYKVREDVVVPAGSLLRGFVSSVKPAGKIDRQGSLTLSFDEAVIDQSHMRVRASVVQALDGKMTQDNTRIGVGAAVGAILGGILGGGKGALVGVLVGGGGTLASTEGADVDLPVGTILRIRLDQPLDVTIGSPTR
jgi:hypothetical protein